MSIFMLLFTKHIQRRLNDYDQTLLQEIKDLTGKDVSALQHYSMNYIVAELEAGKQFALANRLKEAMREVYKGLNDDI
jgi:cytoplasmic iron level regulating protein YaaA (DUF328/UPF0246 family)